MIRYFKWNYKQVTCLCFITLGLLWTGCNEEDTLADDPYAGGREPLQIQLLDKSPMPEAAMAKETVMFYASGLAKYCHTEENKYDFEFYISDERATVLEATDSTVTVRIPENVSSGLAYMVLEEQIFYGPNFKVLGSVSIDEGFPFYKTDGKITGPTSGIINDCLPWCNNSELVSRFYISGDFIKDSKNRLGGLGFVSHKEGLSKYNVENFKINNGIYLGPYYEDTGDGTLQFTYPEIKGLSYMKDKANPRVLMYGFFNSFENGKYVLTNQYANLYLLNNDLSVETETKTIRDVAGVAHDFKSMAKFAGGTKETIIRSWGTFDGKIVAVGNITQHTWIDYDNSVCSLDGSALALTKVETPVGSVLRMNDLGKLDETYRRGVEHTGAVGNIMDACQVEGDDVIIVGEMNSFDGETVPNIVKLKADGTVDNEFLAKVGTGADGAINRVNYYKDETTGKDYVVLAGTFTTFNGKECWGLAVINSKGEVDDEFNIPQPVTEDGIKKDGIEGGRPNFAKIVNISGRPKMVVSGSFTKYGGITRRGFLILELTGDAIQGFNVSGEFSGQLYDAEYSLTSDGANGLLLVGDFRHFDSNTVNNVIMLKVELDGSGTEI